MCIRDRYIKEGPNVYELFVVSVHSGSSMGGHYYVYIKSFENGLWYKYDDSRVTIMNYDVIETAFGEHYPKNNLSLIHISEPTRLGMISYAVFCLKKKKNQIKYKQGGMRILYRVCITARCKD
eukprot:TRINITY_DN1607_c0_g1_i1.p1 TRINITY_DN1607_c0_g1~~TRINITY_DN1607_c0_g1_i1.p1  ORF type:complete len:123 (-),score=15.14 TRINITY_DN1607_c0_g1_i1:2-370(-)